MHAYTIRPSMWLRLVIVLSVVSTLTVVASEACASGGPDEVGTAPSPGALVSRQGGVPTGCTESDSFEPMGPIPALTEKPFWIVLGLVVLGWIVLAADMPDD